MPQGNAGYLPSGLWWMKPDPQTYGPLILKSAKLFGLWSTALGFAVSIRYINKHYDRKDFRGRTMIFKDFTTATHEPLSVEEVDKLKEAERLRKLQKRSALY